MSMSEDFAIAKSFGRRTGVVLQLVNGRGFAYWRWVVDLTRSMHEAEDPEFIREVASKEKEWLMPRGVKFSEEGRKTVSGVTLETVSPK